MDKMEKMKNERERERDWEKKILTVAIVGKNAEQLKLWFIVGGNEN